MTTSQSFHSNELKVAQLQKEQAELDLAATKTMARAIKLTGLFVVLGMIFITALVTHQDPATVRWLGGSLFALGFCGLLLL